MSRPKKCTGNLSSRLAREDHKRERQGYEADPPACRNCSKVRMPVAGGPHSFPICRVGGFSVRLGGVCDVWVGTDGTKLEGAA